LLTHLHTHSYYSLLRGLASPSSLAQAAAQHDMPSLALTDHHLLSGAVEFYDACSATGIRPILGLEASVAVPPDLPLASHPSGILVLLAMDQTGWTGLCRLSSALQTAQDPLASLPFERLADEASGLICLTGGIGGLLSGLVQEGQDLGARAFLDRLKQVFPGRVYVELPHLSSDERGLVPGLASLAQRAALPVVAANAIYYLSPDGAHFQHLLTAMRLNLPLSDVLAHELAPKNAYFTNEQEMAAHFADYPEALAATQEIADRCHLELPLGEPHYPQIPLPSGSTADQLLRSKAYKGAEELYSQVTPDLRARLDHELNVIAALGYASLFLIMEQVVGFACRSGIPISSRGSAASSLVAHCLRITSPDPLRLNLYFERFLNPARATPPDIDTDLSSRHRDEVIRYVYQEYGTQRVAMVSTINRFRRRSALREVAKAYGLSSAKINLLAETLPHRWHGPPPSQFLGRGPFGDLVERYPEPLYQAIFRDAAALLGSPRHLSIHPGGVVIAPGPLTDLVPLQLAAKGVVVTQFDLESIERLGLVKLDLLGIRGLTVLGDVAQAVRTDPHLSVPQWISRPDQSEAPEPSSLNLLESIPEDDPATASLVKAGRTIGCFQIESPGMRATLKEIQAATVDDIMVALALYRPGPLTGGLKDAFVRRHLGQEPVSHMTPALEPLLADTYGVILYQEQVLRIAHELAGLSLADADLLRRAMSHFDPGEQMRTLKEKFIAGAALRSGVPEGAAQRIWDLMAAFAGYGFPKAHAASYALVAWRAAWCKAHYPAVFLAAVLANWGGYYGQRTYLNEVRRLGLALRPPHINFGRREFSVSYQDGQPFLYMGLDQVHHLTRRTQARILSRRPFTSLADFVARVDPRPVEAENLVRAGALQGLGAIPELLSQLQGGSARRAGQLPLFSFAGAPDATSSEDWTLEQKVAAEEAVLGVGVSAHPLDLVADQVAAAGAITTLDAAAQVGKTVRLAGTRQTWRRVRTARGDALYFMTFEDLEGSLNVIISSEVQRRFRQVFSSHRPFLLEGTVERDPSGGEPYIRAKRASSL
jgi:DNA polymerase-3 subunit alpha